jgi:secondary thiamine-phosphate synthase enzyme
MSGFTVDTSRKVEAVDITERLTGSSWPDGLLLVSTSHTTAALIIGEADPEMLEDYERVARDLFATWEPFRHRRNDNPNAAAHLVSSIAGTQVLLPVREGSVVLGTWQRVLLLELDGPKTRRIDLTAIPGRPVGV